MKYIRRLATKAVPSVINTIVGSRTLRTYASQIARNFMQKKIVEEDSRYTTNIRRERYAIASNLLDALEVAFSNESISRSVRRRLIKTFIGRVYLKNAKAIRDVFRREFGREPPGFIVISPGKRCNLKCTGCYAASAAKSTEKLTYDTVDRIVREESDLWNAFFTVISGGEPLMWKSDGKGILDLCRAHPGNYFLMYTNGTLVTKRIAKEMAEVGNITPAISVEGFEKETDERRGEGVFAKVLDAMANLREVGVPFGVSVTATRNNVETVLSDEFVDFFFEKQRAVYGWLFQYMPMGRHPTLDLMVTPGQRKWMFERERHIIHDRHIFFPDFWNGGAFAEGCLAGGRAGGYLHIEWNGNVTPCVFFPYSKDNINEIYARGGNLNDALRSDLMHGIRQWQYDYGYAKQGSQVKNLIAPCSIRDHYAFAHDHILSTGARPIDQDAVDALRDPLYYEGLVEYDNKFQRLTDRIWREEYIQDGRQDAPVDAARRESRSGKRRENGRSERATTQERVKGAGVGR